MNFIFWTIQNARFEFPILLPEKHYLPHLTRKNQHAQLVIWESTFIEETFQKHHHGAAQTPGICLIVPASNVSEARQPKLTGKKYEIGGKEVEREEDQRRHH